MLDAHAQQRLTVLTHVLAGELAINDAAAARRVEVAGRVEARRPSRGRPPTEDECGDSRAEDPRPSRQSGSPRRDTRIPSAHGGRARDAGDEGGRPTARVPDRGLDPPHAYFRVAASAVALAQSALNWTMPESVSG